ncbi:MAG: 4-(cytidine 5'-diphospho)-2-C-methyl-D-erythritol kinase [Candidatus Bipolaricaulota bacterium]|nr:4-(cytidine 5'-diphospho)-2-C-methyl-D-erythritol kinase [Candidatus Bipolaricaulota bacterium]
MRLLAPAKLNLSLRVIGLRRDGFHEIRSIVQPIDLVDVLSVNQVEGRMEVINDNPAIRPAQDLAREAAVRMLEAKHRRNGVRIRIEKHIPIGAGLGGGSSDAAAVLKAIDRLIPPCFSSERLGELAARIGSDVPLFLSGGAVLATGRGEQITPYPTQRKCFLLVVPPVHCSTPAVYERFDRIGRGDASDGHFGQNDLERAALDLYPELVHYRAAVEALNSEFFGMSGSGATYFAAFPHTAAAAEARDRLAGLLPDSGLYLCSANAAGCEEGERCRLP